VSDTVTETSYRNPDRKEERGAGRVFMSCQGRSSWSKIAPGSTHDHVGFSRCKSYLERQPEIEEFKTGSMGEV
jgi:hypothetical protein